MWRPQACFALVATLAFAACVDNQVSKNLPEFFRTGLGSFIILQTLAFSLVGSGYFSLRCSLRNRRYHLANLLILAACIGVVAVLGWRYLEANRTVALLISESYKYRSQSLYPLVDGALRASKPEQRASMARTLYGILGVQAAYADHEGRLVIYLPTEDDQADFASLKASRLRADQGLSDVQDTLSTVPGTGMKVILIFGGWLILFFVGDLARDAWLRSRGEQAR